jgi:hypothetical protein
VAASLREGSMRTVSPAEAPAENTTGCGNGFSVSAIRILSLADLMLADLIIDSPRNVPQ